MFFPQRKRTFDSSLWTLVWAPYSTLTVSTKTIQSLYRLQFSTAFYNGLRGLITIQVETILESFVTIWPSHLGFTINILKGSDSYFTNIWSRLLAMNR